MDGGSGVPCPPSVLTLASALREEVGVSPFPAPGTLDGSACPAVPGLAMGDPEPSPQRERFDRSRQREEREEREEAERLKEREAQKTFWKAFAEEKVARNRSEDAHFKRFLRNLARAVWRFVLPYRPEKRDPQIMAALAARSGVGDGPIIEA